MMRGKVERSKMNEEIEKGQAALRLIVFQSYAYFCQITLRLSQPKLI